MKRREEMINLRVTGHRMEGSEFESESRSILPTPFPHCYQSCYAMTSPLPRRPGFDPGPVHVGFVADKVAPVQVSLPVLRLPPYQYHSTNAPYLSPYWYYFYQKDKRAKGGNLQTKQSSFGYRDSAGQNTALILLSEFESLNGRMQGISGVRLTPAVAYLNRQQSVNTGDRGPTVRKVAHSATLRAASRAIEIPLPSRADNCLFPCRCNQTL